MKARFNERQFRYIIDTIIDIFDSAPRIEKGYFCHDEYHPTYGVDEKIRNERLEDFMKYIIEIQATSKIELFGENIKETIKIFKNFSKQGEPPSIPKHGILKRGI